MLLQRRPHARDSHERKRPAPLDWILIELEGNTGFVRESEALLVCRHADGKALGIVRPAMVGTDQ